MALTLITSFPNVLADYGNTAVAGDTSFNVPYPPSISAGNLLILCVGLKPNTATISTPSGWTAPTNGNATGGTGSQGNDTGQMRVAVFYKIATGSESGSLSVTLGSTPNNACGFMLRVTSATGNYDVVAANGSDNTAGSAWSTTAGQTISFAAGDILIPVAAFPTDASTGSWSAESIGTGAAVNDWIASTPYHETTVGQDSAIRATPVSITSGSATTAPTHSATAAATATNIAGPEVFLRIREASGAVTGAAALSGDGALTTVARVDVKAAAALTADGTMTPAAKLDVRAASALSADGSLTAVGVRMVLGSATLSAESSMTTAGRVDVKAASALTAESSLITASVLSIFGVAPLTSESSLTAASRVDTFAAAALSGDSSLVTAGVVNIRASTVLAGDGLLFASGDVEGSLTGQALLTAESNLTVSAVVSTTGSASLSSESSLTVSALLDIRAGALLSGESDLLTSALLSIIGSSTLEGNSNLAVSGDVFLDILPQPPVIIVYRTRTVPTGRKPEVIIVYRPRGVTIPRT